ncbi:NADPH-dependent FMN reductase [Limosilactobacillus caccae]|uniref:NADPH-dependent FMN reductase n=1 Tax=Limosilactobacillus caccae TaxID=1926284 RepID=UPI0009713508|nr:NADPH-dependent FMN reductase [Limosilactobacillus caccae]
MQKVGIVIGSVRPNRRSMQVAAWLKRQLQKETKVQYDLIDLKKVDLPMMAEPHLPVTGLYTQQKTRAWSALIQQYDGFIFVFPQYNWGYPAVLKNAIDYLAKEWQGKPVSLVTFGGHGGTQAQLAMKMVIAGLKMQALPVNLQIDLLPADSLAVAERKLNSYNWQVELLSECFDKFFKQQRIK